MRIVQQWVINEAMEITIQLQKQMLKSINDAACERNENTFASYCFSTQQHSSSILCWILMPRLNDATIKHLNGPTCEYQKAITSPNKWSLLKIPGFNLFERIGIWLIAVVLSMPPPPFIWSFVSQRHSVGVPYCGSTFLSYTGQANSHVSINKTPFSLFQLLIMLASKIQKTW